MTRLPVGDLRLVKGTGFRMPNANAKERKQRRMVRVSELHSGKLVDRGNFGRRDTTFDD